LVIPSPNSEETSSGHLGTTGGEFAAIARIRRGLESRFAPPRSGEVWIGDDAAVVEAPKGRLLLATDLSVAGVHADLDVMGLDDLGWRALVSAVSDIAAMGGSPGHALVGVAGPPSTDLELLYEGIGAAAEAHDCPVVGGDLSTASELVVSVALTGRVEEPPPPVTRSGASPGDSLLVTGVLGASAAGLRLLRGLGLRRAPPREPSPDETLARGTEAALLAAHLRPRARLKEGDLARRAGASAMIDISDGLAADLGHLAEASGVGFDLDQVPVAAGARESEALGGGEDYELVIAAADPDRVIRAFAVAGLDVPIPVGVCTPEMSRRTLRGVALPLTGFEHPWG
jgi:thiamine-monophosphate kinase